MKKLRLAFQHFCGIIMMRKKFLRRRPRFITRSRLFALFVLLMVIIQIPPLLSLKNSGGEFIKFDSVVEAAFRRRLGRATSYLEFGSRANVHHLMNAAERRLTYAMNFWRIRVVSILPQSNTCIATRSVHCVSCCGQSYLEQIERLEQSTWDVVRVDGDARTSVVLATLPFLHKNSIVALHGGRKTLDQKIMLFFKQVEHVRPSSQRDVRFLMRHSHMFHMEGNLRAVKRLIAEIEDVERLELRSPFRERRLITRLNDNVGSGQCFEPNTVNFETSCATCVNFLTIAVTDSPRWESFDPFVPSLRVVAGTLRRSQKCFKLYVYTNANSSSEAGQRLIKAGGENVILKPFPTDLPRTAYTNHPDPWISLSRSKIDVVEKHMQHYNHKVIWTDMDTLITTDLSCAYARASNFVVSRWLIGSPLEGPKNEQLYIHPQRVVFGDLWMVDHTLIGRVRDLENSGMPRPMYDLQDYFSYLLNKCDGAVTDLRSVLREDGFASGGGMCLGFDWANGEHPDPRTVSLTLIDGNLRCAVHRADGVQYYPIASMSFIAPSFKEILENPKVTFKTTALRQWAEQRGFTF